MNKSEIKYFSTAQRMDEALIECLEKKDFEYITVKEICRQAGVNRSTFYLHYETVGNLLNECVEYMNNKCFQRYSADLTDVKKRLASGNSEDLIFISPEYLKPYFEFVMENRRLFSVALSNPTALDTVGTFRKLFAEIFSPILDRFNFSEQEKPYIIMFYIGGLIAIVKKWLSRDCSDPIDRIIDVCMGCIIPERERGKGQG